MIELAYSEIYQGVENSLNELAKELEKVFDKLRESIDFEGEIAEKKKYLKVIDRNRKKLEKYGKELDLILLRLHNCKKLVEGKRLTEEILRVCKQV